MITFQYTVTDPLGVHARPAGLLVREAGRFQSTVFLRIGERSADAKRLFAVMGISVRHGDTITVEISGADETWAAEELQAFFAKNL